MADTISIDMANVLSYLRKRRADVVNSVSAPHSHHYNAGQAAAYDDCLDKITQVLTSHARSWAKFAHSLEQQVEHEQIT